MLRLTPVVKNLLIINIVVFILQKVLVGMNFSAYISLWKLSSEYFYPYQFFSYMFAHGDFFHIMFNMLGLVFLGPLLEQFWGSKKFVTFYLVTGIGAGVLYSGIELYMTKRVESDVTTLMADPNPQRFIHFLDDHIDPSVNEKGRPNEELFIYANYNYQAVNNLANEYDKNPENRQLEAEVLQVAKDKLYVEKNVGTMLGASGAVYGILMAFGLLFPNTQLMLLIPPIPIKAKYLVLILGGIALYSGLNRESGDNVAHFAHLGGMIFAFIMIKIWQQSRDKFY